MTHPDATTVQVADDADVVLAGRETRATLERIEFDETTVEEVVLVVHELASNIVKHAGAGSITLTLQTDGERTGIEIYANDTGPGIADVGQAVVDGYSTSGSLGGGLGAIYRLMDTVVIESDGDREAGFEVVATRWQSASSVYSAPPIVVGAATRAMPGHDQNGDAFLIEHGAETTLVGVIDGLGHGEAAHQASSAAQQYVRTHSTQPLSDIFEGVERACRNTRGVVMLLARFDWNTATVTLGSVGNITLRVCHSPKSRHLTPKRGVLGGNAPAPVIAEWDWSPASVMVVHSDGLRSNWQCDEFSLRDGQSVTAIADDLLTTLSTHDDDATVLVITEATP
ncbi:ATP-binding protein [Haladaptatus sp. DJG-WS-42]|uniref:ATP-binding protein n=1 Tax=Haladaptatus sp. DJG-WS-42 TaxID=3120516 RepID=UPI0030D5DF56